MVALVRFVLGLAPRVGGAWLASAVAGAAASLATAVLIGQVVGATPAFVSGGPDALSLPGIALLVAGLVVAFTVDGALVVLTSMTMDRLVYESDVVINRSVSAALVASPGVQHLDSAVVSDEARQARGVGNRAIWVGLVPLGGLVRSRLLAVGSAVVVGWTFSWPIAGLLLATTAVVEWWSARMSAVEKETWQRGTQAGREADYAYELGLGGVAGAPKELRIFGFDGWLSRRHAQDWWRGVRPLWRARQAAMVRTMLVYGLHLSALAVAVWMLAREVAAGALGLTVVATVLAAMLRLVMAANGVAASAVERGSSALAALYRLPETVGVAGKRVGRSGVPVLVDPERPKAGPPEVRFEGVRFRYPGADVDVLRELDLSIGAGEAIGLVGLNGAGKSTLVQLLAGGYRPTAGRILLDGVDLAELDGDELAAWQRRLAPVTQEFLRLPLTAAENVTLAEQVDPDRLAAVAETAGIESAVSDLPEGWETMLDRSVAAGGELSGGQWQRLALARALYAVRGGAGMLVLDEPAAALDVRAEAELVQRYLELTSGVTSLLISHRFSVVRDADRICVLENGRVAEQGTHDELLAADGRYARMFGLQAARYVGGGSDA